MGMKRVDTAKDVGAKTFTARELLATATSGKDDRLLIAIDGRVHDVTGWTKHHPGGATLLKQHAGHDASDVFAAFHAPEVYRKLRAFDVGAFEPDDAIAMENSSDSESDDAFSDDSVAAADRSDLKKQNRARELAAFRDLRERVRKEGLFEPSYAHMFGTFLRLFVIGAFAAVFSFAPNSTPRGRILGAALLGLFWQQSLLIAHDACPRVMTTNTKVDKWIGSVFGTLIGGVGAAWWNMEHCEHHCVTQVVGGDPSAGAAPVLCLEPQTKGLPKIGRALVKLQALYYVPVCIFIGRFNLHLISILKAPSKGKALDVALMTGYMSYVYGLTRLVPESERWRWFMIANAVCGVLHLILNMNHYPMPMLSFPESQALGWLRFQCVTTMNIASSSLTGWYYGGLEWQIEHHLFPTMPRHNLRKVSHRVKELCLANGVPYHVAEGGFWDANWSVMKTLHDVARGLVI
jgi:delta8-fatty-acid desaturase